MARILYIVHRFWPYAGGSERYFLEVARRTAGCGHAVTVFTTDAWDYEHLYTAGKQRIERLRENVDGVRIRRFRVRHIPKENGIFESLSLLAKDRHLMVDRLGVLLPGLRWTLHRMTEHFDLVHAGVFPFTSLVGAAAAYCQRRRIPFVCQPMLNLGEPYLARHDPNYLNRKELRLLMQADGVVANTDFEVEVLRDTGVAREAITVASPAVNPIDVAGGDGSTFRGRHGITGLLVLQISTQTFDKGSPHTVEALKILRSRGYDATVVLIGSVISDFRQYLAAQPPDLQAHLRVLDYTSEQEKKDALAACDVFVMPSRSDSFGIVYLEAWLYQKPVIGCFAGGVPRVIDDGADGFLIPFGDCHMLAEYIAALHAHPELAARMGRQGRAKVLARYTWEHTHPKILAVYERLLKQRAVGTSATLSVDS